MSSYCTFASGHPVHGRYHDTEHGFPSCDEAVLFERLCLEIMQAGLSWDIVLKRRSSMQAAFKGFQVDLVASFGPDDIARLLADPGIIRNRLKVEAIVENARVIQTLRQSHGGFAEWVDAHHPMDKSGWVRLFRRTFRFTGGEIVGEFLMSLGWLRGAHTHDCPVYGRIAAISPPWQRCRTSPSTAT